MRVSSCGCGGSNSLRPAAGRDEGPIESVNAGSDNCAGKKRKETVQRRRVPRDSQKIPEKPSEAVDARGDASGAEAVVNVDDGYIRCATVEHTEQRGDAAEAGTVADAGGNGDHRHGDEAADDARQCAFHSCNADDDAGFGEFASMIEQAMDAGYANVIERLGAIAHHAGSEQGLFRDGNVAGTGGDDKDRSFPDDFGAALDGDHA